MGFWDRLTGQFVDVIEWTDDDGRTMAQRFERQGNEIKYGAKLIVREGQAAVFVKEGQLADTFSPGTYTLETRNLPILSTLAAWKHGFDSPFKAEVWFVSTKRFTGIKWGTKNPIMLRDPEFGPVRLRAFGTFSIGVLLPARFLKEVVGTESRLERGEISETLRDFVVARIARILGRNEVPILDLAGHYGELGNYLEHRAREDFHRFGLSLMDVLVENVSLPPKVEKALDQRSSMAIIGDADAYLRYRMAEGLGADSGDSGIGAGVGAGIGVAMAKDLLREAPPRPDAELPPPIPSIPPLFIAEGGSPAGPFERSQWPELIASGRLNSESLVWSKGMDTWVAADSLDELAPLLADSPPPIPGS